MKNESEILKNLEKIKESIHMIMTANNLLSGVIHTFDLRLRKMEEKVNIIYELSFKYDELKEAAEIMAKS